MKFQPESSYQHKLFYVGFYCMPDILGHENTSCIHSQCCSYREAQRDSATLVIVLTVLGMFYPPPPSLSKIYCKMARKNSDIASYIRESACMFRVQAASSFLFGLQELSSQRK